VIGTDYGHSDSSTEIEALRMMKKDNRIPANVIDKILGDKRAARASNGPDELASGAVIMAKGYDYIIVGAGLGRAACLPTA